MIKLVWRDSGGNGRELVLASNSGSQPPSCTYTAPSTLHLQLVYRAITTTTVNLQPTLAPDKDVDGAAHTPTCGNAIRSVVLQSGRHAKVRDHHERQDQIAPHWVARAAQRDADVRVGP
eukprot:6014459-Heterocapsa_arctica.AAC.1